MQLKLTRALGAPWRRADRARRERCPHNRRAHPRVNAEQSRVRHRHRLAVWPHVEDLPARAEELEGHIHNLRAALVRRRATGDALLDRPAVVGVESVDSLVELIQRDRLCQHFKVKGTGREEKWTVLQVPAATPM